MRRGVRNQAVDGRSSRDGEESCGRNFRRSAGVSELAAAESLNEDPGNNGAPGEIRTPDLQLRRLPLYPAELRARTELLEFTTFDGGHQTRHPIPLAEPYRIDITLCGLRDRATRPLRRVPP